MVLWMDMDEEASSPEKKQDEDDFPSGHAQTDY